MTTRAYGARHALPSRITPRDALPALGSLIAATLLAGAATAGRTALGLALLGAQAIVLFAWLALTEVDGAEGAAVIVFAAAAAADVLAVRDEGAGISGAVTVVALAFVASLAFQLFRRHRQRTTDALAGTVSAVVLVVLGAHLLAVSAKSGGKVAAVTVLCAAAALLAGRAGDLAFARPALARGARRGVLGLVLAVAAAALLGTALGAVWAPLSKASGCVLGVACGLAAVAADLGVDLAGAEAQDRRRASALRPLSVLLPLLVAAPVAYAATRLLIG